MQARQSEAPAFFPASHWGWQGIASSQENINIKQWLPLGVNAEAEKEMKKQLNLQEGLKEARGRVLKTCQMHTSRGIKEKFFLLNDFLL